MKRVLTKIYDFGTYIFTRNGLRVRIFLKQGMR